ncbi:MAG: threonine aldolase family protein [Solirubrobacteraceae bacterium]
MSFPVAPINGFESDNAAGVHPRVMDALIAANVGSSRSYGADRWTRSAVRRFHECFEAPAETLFVYGGTGANVFALQCALAPYESVICTSVAHINTDECGAVERHVGAKLLSVETTDGKLRPDLVSDVLSEARAEHRVVPRVLSITQPTELGTLYTLDELAALGELARQHGLLVHLDGARIANAAAALGCSLAETTLDVGADLLVLGGTKSGLMYGEAVVFFKPELTRHARLVRKQCGQLASKMRFISAQFDALLTDDLWLENASHANAMARQLAQRVARIPAVKLARDPHVNTVFATLPIEAVAPLRDWSFFWTLDSQPGLARWMTSFATAEEDVRRFTAGVERAVERASPSARRDPSSSREHTDLAGTLTA